MNTRKNTSYTFILDMIKNGLKLEFNEIPFQLWCKNIPLSKEDMSVNNSYLQKLKCNKVIVSIDKRTGDYFSGVFTRSKKDNSRGMVINLHPFQDGANTKYVKCD